MDLNGGVTVKITSAITASQTTITVDSTEGTFAGAYLLIDSEAILITNIDSLTLTVKRGQYNTTAVSHSDNAACHHFFGWRPFQDTACESSYPNIHVEMQSGLEQVQRKSINKISRWEYQYRGLKDEMDAIKKFVDLRFGSWEPFKWQDASYQIHTVRFGVDTVKVIEKRALEDGLFIIVGYELSEPLKFRKVNM